MNGDEQRPSGGSAEAQPQHDAPEPGNARVPQAPQQQGGQNGQPQGEGGGRRRFRRQRRGGRGRGRRNQHNQQVQPPLDAQGRIVDVANDEADDGPEPGEPQAASAAGEPMGSQTGADIAGGPSAPGAPPPSSEAASQPAPQQQQHPRPQQQSQQRPPQQQRQQRQEPTVPCEGVLDVDHRGNGRLRVAKYSFLP